MRRAPEIALPQYNKRAALLLNRERCRAHLDALKAEGDCARCPARHPPWRLQFDHKPGFKKRFNISEARSGRIPFNELLKELKKTQKLCANCHLDEEHLRSLTVAPTRRRHAA